MDWHKIRTEDKLSNMDFMLSFIAHYTKSVVV